MRPGHLALLFFACIFLLSPISNAFNVDPFQSDRYYTYIAPRLVDDPGGTKSVQALLYTYDLQYYSDTDLVYEQWWAALTSKESLFSSSKYQPSTNYQLKPLAGKTLKFYSDTNLDGLATVDPSTGAVNPLDAVLLCTVVTGTDPNNPVVGSDPSNPLNTGFASCQIPPAYIPDLRCSSILIVFEGEPATPAVPATGATPAVPAVPGYLPGSASTDICGNFKLPVGAVDTSTCMPVFILFGLLAGAMYAAGRNPLVLFDISTPRLPRPKPYGMRRTTVGTGGALQRLAINKQLRLSQALGNIAIRRAAQDLARSGVSRSEIDALMAEMKRIDRRSNHEIAAALRILGSRQGMTASQALAQVDEIKRAANARAQAENMDAMQRELLEKNSLRRVIHIGAEDQRGRGVFGAAGRLRHQATFRALHDALWHEENARRALAANAIAYGQDDWFNLKTAGTKAGAAIDQATGSNRAKGWLGTTLNWGPRLSDKGFLGAFAAGTIGKARLVTALTTKLVTTAVPVFLGLRSSKAKVGKAYDAEDALAKGLDLQVDAMNERFDRLIRYLKIGGQGTQGRRALAKVFFEIDATDPKKMNEAAFRRLLAEKLEMAKPDDRARWQAILAFQENFRQAKRLDELKTKLNGVYAEFKAGRKSALQAYHEINQVLKDCESLTTIRYRAEITRNGQKVLREASMNVFTTPYANGEFNEVTRNTIIKYKMRELGLFAVEHGALEGGEADFKKMWAEGPQDNLRALFKKYSAMPEDPVLRGQVEKEFASLLRKVTDKFEAEAKSRGSKDIEVMDLQNRLKNLLGFDYEHAVEFARNNARARFGGREISLLDAEAVKGVAGNPGFRKTMYQIGSLHDIDPEKQATLERREFADKSTHDLVRNLRVDFGETGMMNVLEKAARDLGMPGDPRRNGQQLYRMTQTGALDRETDKQLRDLLIGTFTLKRRFGFTDELRQALVEGLGREEWSQGIKGLTEQVRFVGGDMVDISDFHKRLERDAMALKAMNERNIRSGANITVDQLAKGVWIATPDDGLIPYVASAMKDEKGNVKFLVGGADKVIHGKLDIDTQTGKVEVHETTGLQRNIGNRLDAAVFSTLENFNDRMVEAKSVLKYNKQAYRAMEHGPVATLGISTEKGATGAFAGEYSLLTERRQTLDDAIQRLAKNIRALELGARASDASTIQEKLREDKKKLDEMYREFDALDVQQRSMDERRYHEAYFKFARHFREIDDTLTVGKTQRALSSTWGGSAYVDMLYNVGMSMPWTPWHGIRGRMPMGTPTAIALQPGWMVGKYFAERLRPYALLASGMPIYSDVQEHGMQIKWKEAVKSIIPFSPESIKFWEWKRMDTRDPKRYKALDTDADIFGAKGFELMNEMKQQKKTLEDAMHAAAAEGRKADEKRLKDDAEAQERRIKEEFSMLQRGYYRVIDENTPHLGPTQFTDEYKSVFMRYSDKAAETMDDSHVRVDSQGRMQYGELNRPMEADAETIRLISPTYHRSIIGTAPIDTLGDHFMSLGTVLKMTTLASWIANIPLSPAYYDFDSYEPDPTRHGRSGFIGTHNAYHQPVGGVYGIASAVLPIPFVGPLLAQSVAALPVLGFTPIALDPDIWGAKAAFTGEYVEKGYTGATHMWSKWNPRYEQLPLYRMGNDQPVAGVTYFSPYKYMDPNLVMNLTGKYEYLIEPHENITAYPHLADELERNMNITELINKRNSELAFFQRWSRAQFFGSMVPALGMVQSIPMVLSAVGADKESYQVRDWIEKKSFFGLANALIYKHKPDNVVRAEQQIIATHLYVTCRSCGLSTKGGQFCPNCGKFAVTI
ncbi:Uncharacterised protein [Candidatus Burarchaeum australiense]|nr:Uncharacterised protein [Candidatus Burarchaeum australiense]